MVALFPLRSPRLLPAMKNTVGDFDLGSNNFTEARCVGEGYFHF